MIALDYKRTVELEAECAAEPVDRAAIWDAIISKKPIPEHITRERLAVEIVQLMSSLGVSNMAASMGRERYSW